MNYATIFITGLAAGGFSCLALQGGLLATTLANIPPNKDRQSHLIPTLAFLFSRLAAYTILGGLLGYFGSFLQFSDSIRYWFQIIAAIFMLGLAANMLGLHPVFRYFVITPPKWAGKLLRKQARDGTWFAPVIVGLFTVFIPCAITQSMVLLAVASGSWTIGSAILASFMLGSSPIFLVIGWVTTQLSEKIRFRFYKFAAVMVTLVALTSLNGALVLLKSPLTVNHLVWKISSVFLTSPTQSGEQQLTIYVTSRGYNPSYLTVKSDSPVTLNLVTNNSYSCANDFVIPALNIRQRLPPTGSSQVTFTPRQPGPLVFSCSMGMYTGTINVL